MDVPLTVPKPKHSLLPVLVALFVLSYGLMTMLIVEQGRTIQAQRTLISQLYGDSLQLNQIQRAEVEKRNGHLPAKPNAAPQAKTPDIQVAPKQESKPSAGKLHRALPQKPPSNTSEMADERRNLTSI